MPAVDLVFGRETSMTCELIRKLIRKFLTLSQEKFVRESTIQKQRRNSSLKIMDLGLVEYHWKQNIMNRTIVQMLN